ncbi:hypothetical protein K2X14_06145 [Acetobacter sp. TBRC 12305]|uniref:Uncharacterized protein n=1 Tax=Acetobacter garciniae TaxID=2817435 RepID=A0A939KLY8_9PROT|nr:hypothetical protein [Acetobacter garciniae]MBO1324728.1 hypothetical protein [Acetobacter garciniae]MBX0344419.1 hypothetical protein [Acetobacter garciniae]
MRFVQRIAALVLPVAVLAGAATVAHADPCLSIGSCAQEGVSNQIGATRNAISRDGEQLTSGATNMRRNLKNGVSSRIDGARDSATNRVSNAENSVTNRVNTAANAPKNAVKKERNRLSSDVQDATTLPRF